MVFRTRDVFKAHGVHRKLSKYQMYSHNQFRSPPDGQGTQISVHHVLGKCCSQDRILKIFRNSFHRDSWGKVSQRQASAKESQPQGPHAVGLTLCTRSHLCSDL